MNYKDEYLEVYYKDMREDDEKEIEYVVKLGNTYLTIGKPRIEKNFCFGHGQNGLTTQEGQNNANQLAKKVRESQEFFINKKLETLNKIYHSLLYHKIRLIEGYDKAQKFYQQNEKFIPYIYTRSTPYLVSYDYPKVVLEFLGYTKEQDTIHKATANDIEKLLFAYGEVTKNFKKRLKTYLKRYGLSKVNSHTYLTD